MALDDRIGHVMCQSCKEIKPVSGEHHCIINAPLIINAPSIQSEGVKADAEKLRFDLLPAAALEATVQVLTYGAQKYDDENWRKVPGRRRRYFAACMRHLWAWAKGEAEDAESGISHLAHAVCCLLFLLDQDLGGTALDLGGE